MNKWEQQFHEHQIFTTLTDVLAKLQGLQETATEADAVLDLERLDRLAKRSKSILNRSDAGIAFVQHLNGAQTHLNNALTELNAYEGDKAASRLGTANQQLEGSVSTLSALPQIETVTDLTELQEAIVSFRRSISQHLRNAQEENKALATATQELRARVDETKGEIQQQKTRLDEAIAEFQRQFSSAEDTRRQQAQDAVAKVQALLTELQEKFGSAQETRAEKFNEQLVALQKQLDDNVVALQKTQADAQQKFTDQATVIVEALNQRKSDAEKIVGAIAQTGMVGGYQRIANREKWTTYIWQIMTVGAIIGFICVLSQIVTTGPQYDSTGKLVPGAIFTWPALIKRVLISLAFGALAAYAGREAAKAAEKERRYRKLELELASIGPFLATLPKDKQDEAIKNMADRVFGSDHDTPIKVDDAPATANGLIEVLKLAISALKSK